MSYKVNDLVFTKDDLVEISISDISVNMISRGHMIFLLSDKKAIILHKAGDLIEAEFIKKHTSKKTKLYLYPIAKEDEIDLFKSLLIGMKVKRPQKQQSKYSLNIFENIISKSLKGESSILAFVIACYENMSFLDDELVQSYQTKGTILLSRSLVTSALTVLNSIFHNYNDYDLIKDLYNLSLILDIGLVYNGHVSIFLLEACEKERVTPGEGVSYLTNKKRPQYEIDSFKKHPIMSYQVATTYKKYFENEGLVNIIKYHHEKHDGSGFPWGYSYSELGMTDVILSFSDYFIPFNNFDFHLEDSKDLLKTLEQQFKNKENIEVLLVNRMIMNWGELIQKLMPPMNKEALSSGE